MKRLFPLVAMTCIVLAGCTTENPTTGLADTPDLQLAEADVAALSAEERQQLAELRRLTAPFHNFEKATEAGWSVQFTPCLSHPTDGAMGYHYANPAFIDGEAVLLEPELLLFEPQKNGKLRFVGVEYVIPFSEVPPDAEPPSLLGHDFHTVPAAGIWGLHVWVGRHNPSGMFADWNPNVTCAYAED